jgi:hypothetical protein
MQISAMARPTEQPRELHPCEDPAQRYLSRAIDGQLAL